jgi:tRNA C32,U32 (ribose-2'-O)-methylase TrmJ
MAQESDLLDSPDLDLRLIRKAEAVIRQRSGTLTVVIERATNMFNHSACLRTAEALGIHNVWIVDPQACNDEFGASEETREGNVIRDTKNRLLKLTTEEAEERRQHHLFAKNATEWLSIREFQTTMECVKALRDEGYQIYVTDLSQKAVELSPDDLLRHGRWPLPEKLAIVFGTEAVGCSAEMLDAADLRVYLPLRGFADSLNLSVATALIVHHLLMLQPKYVASMTEDEQHNLRKLWYPKLARQRLLCSKDKKKRRKLKADISRMETTKAQQERGTPMNAQQLEKIAKLDAYKEELRELEELGQFGASEAIVQELIENPPEPL